jgi:hypothetical protein
MKCDRHEKNERERSRSAVAAYDPPPPPPSGASASLALIERGVRDIHAGRDAAAAISFSRLLLLYPLGHPARRIVLAVLDGLQATSQWPCGSASRQS